jgi:hypothetical protein
VNVRVLIDNVVRQTTVLIAELATAAGIRAPLAHLANKVFLELVRELEAQGLGRKLIADMFGLALRSYELKVQRLSESATERDRSLWEAVIEMLRMREVATRAELAARFHRDDPATLDGVLDDLVESGLVFRAGRGATTVYRAADEGELRRREGDVDQGVNELVWIAVYRLGPISRSQLLEHIHLEKATLDDALEQLVISGAIEVIEQVDGTNDAIYSAERCIIPLGAQAGWEAALFDHFQAVVNALAIKLREGVTQTLPGDVLGGSTYSFDIWPGHPMEFQVLGLLGHIRRQLSALRAQVTNYNTENGQPGEGRERVTFYFGQSVWAEPNGQYGAAGR